MKTEGMWKMFYKEIEPGSAFRVSGGTNFENYFPLSANHGGTFMGSMCVHVCPKKLGIHHCQGPVALCLGLDVRKLAGCQYMISLQI